MRKIYTNEFKTKVITKFKKSKKSVTTFCKENDIPLSTFNRWLYDDNAKQESTTTFGRINLQDENNQNMNTSTNVNENINDTIKIITSNIEISFKSGSDIKVIKSLLEAIFVD